MTPRQLRRELRSRRKALLRELRRREAAAREERRTRTRGGRGRRRLLWVALVAVVLFALLHHCDCTARPDAPRLTARPAPAAKQAEVEQHVGQPLTGRISRRPRPEYENRLPGPRPWIASFRMQVAARSPRLATCFEGADQPGMLRWTAAVDPALRLVAAVRPRCVRDPYCWKCLTISCYASSVCNITLEAVGNVSIGTEQWRDAMPIWTNECNGILWDVVRDPWTNEEFVTLCNSIRDADRAVSILTIAFDSQPANARQRAMLADAMSMLNLKALALVSTSRLVRGVLTAVQWFSSKTHPEKAFAEVTEALDWLEAVGVLQNRRALVADIARIVPAETLELIGLAKGQLLGSI